MSAGPQPRLDHYYCLFNDEESTDGHIFASEEEMKVIHDEVVRLRPDMSFDYEYNYPEYNYVVTNITTPEGVAQEMLMNEGFIEPSYALSDD